MAQFRIHKNDNFTVLSNLFIQDPNISNRARGLLVLLLSLPKNWNYTIKGLKTICPKDGQNTIISQLKELENAGYLIRYRQRDKHGRVKESVFDVYEVPWWTLPEDERPDKEIPNQKIPNQEIPNQEIPNQEIPNQENPIQQSTKEINTNQLSTYLTKNPSINLDRTDRRSVEEFVKGMIDFDILANTPDGERIQEIVTVMADILCTTKDIVRINNEDVPYNDVADRFLKIDSEHIQYVLECIDKNPAEIKNMRAYIPTVLFNAPTTMNNDISALFERTYNK